MRTTTLIAGLAALPTAIPAAAAPPTYETEVYYDVNPRGMTPDAMVVGSQTEAFWDAGTAAILDPGGEIDTFGDLDAAYSYFQHVTSDGTAYGIGWATEGPDPFISWSRAEGFKVLGTFPGTLHGEVEDCNDAHQVIAWAENASIESEPTHAYVWQAGAWTNLGTLRDDPEAWTAVYPEAINNDGVIVGSSVTDVADGAGGLKWHAYRWTADDGMVDLGTAAGELAHSHAYAVNASGQIAGSTQTPVSGSLRAAVWSADGEITVIGPEGYSSAAQLITDSGIVYGRLSDVELGTRAFRWTPDEGFQILDQIGLSFHEFRDATDDGTAVGATLTPNYTLEAVAYIPGEGLVSLNDLISGGEAGQLTAGVTITEDGRILAAAQGLNDAGQVQHRTVILTPTCAADMNGDGSLDVLDFVAFQDAFLAQDPGADCDANGAFQVTDFVCYQALFTGGCD